ncbi:hypothetical protein [Nostoc sp.]|uniref:hypothetical protein n=1 Tax=Nostoc sp. TaxID=1180 RepID=UPI002FF6DC90
MYKEFRQQVISAIRDAVNNVRYPKRILVVRQADHQSTYNDYFLYWVSQNVPEAAHLFELHYLPCEIKDWDRYALFIPWLQDPLKERFPHIYQYAQPIEAECKKRNIPIVNSIDNLSNSIKSLAAQRIGSVEGIRTAKTVPITDLEAFKKTQGGLSTPFFIREDWVHGCQIFFVQNLDDLENIPFEKMLAPIAVEFLDVREEDGLYRKYRYFAMGDEGIPGPLMVSKSWEVRDNDNRVINESIIAEEIAYFSGEDRNHHLLQQARKALGFDFMAFDYSYDEQKNLIVWEPNPFPVIWGSHDGEPEKKYTLPSMDRIYIALLKYYLQRANISIKIPT